MASLGVVVLSLLFCLPNTAISEQYCFDSLCNITGPAIRFPFAVKYNQLYGCGYPGFDLSCNDRKQTILNLPSSGDFAVQSIDYKANKITINDPKSCLPKRFLATHFSISGAPFFILGPYNRIREYTFLNCSGTTLLNFMQVPCLSGDTYSVVAALSEVVANKTFWSCDKLSNVLVPQGLDDSWDISDDIQLKWRIPGCVSCEEKGGVCGLKSDTTGLVLGCSNLTSHGGHGLPMSAKYGLIIGIGIPGLLCIIGFTCFISGTARSYDRAPGPRGTTVNLGIDGSTIESYPKMVLGASRRLLNPNDGTCSICLSEYQPKETLRIIPECNHYFHVQCIDEWLKKNATCPLCRNLPEEASLAIPFT